MVAVYVFLALLLVYVALGGFAPTASKLSRGTFLLGNALLVFALILNWRAFLGTPPFKPLLLVAALFCGQLLYMLAVLATKLSLKEAISAAIPSQNIAISCRRRPLLLLQYCLAAIYEEFLWRATAQPFLESLLMNAAVAVVVTACLFTLLHQKMFAHNVERAEFLSFSLVLGLIYYLTSSLLFVVIVHAIRDINIKCKVPARGLGEDTEPSGLVRSGEAEREPAPGDVTRSAE